MCSWLSRLKWPTSWLSSLSLACRYRRFQSRAPITSSSGRNSQGRFTRPSPSSRTPAPQGISANWRSRWRGADFSQFRSSGLLLGIQNICSSRVLRRTLEVSCSCFWLSCRVMDSLSRLFSSRLRRSSSSLRVLTRSVRVARSSGVTCSGGCSARRPST
ncbi:hypothetical protein D9M71_455180 [compost metagenome]